jgi:hypothetical protein
MHCPGLDIDRNKPFYAFLISLLCASISLCSACPGFAAYNDWAEGTSATTDGATKTYYNRAGRLEWDNSLGDWRDADDLSQGSRPYAAADIQDTNTARFIEWDVRGLVQEWVDGTHPNQGFFIHALSGKGPIHFRSREHVAPSQRPQLVIDSGDGEKTLTPEADTYLHDSTDYSLGHNETLTLHPNDSNILLRFDLSAIATGTRIAAATLRLYTHAQYGDTSLQAGLFRCSQGEALSTTTPIGGLAAGYEDDRGIGGHPNVIFATGFEADNWKEEWSSARGHIDVVDTDDARKFSPLMSKALRAKIPEGENASMSVLYKFADKIGEEPEEIYFRYYLRFADDWNQTVFSGKLPGISGTYGEAGWGGRKPDGTDGWSARGTYLLSISGDNPLAGTHPIGTYCYYADQPTRYGDTWPWRKEYKGFLSKNRWHCIEQYVRMNTPAEHDGVVRAWVDGRPAFEKEDIMFRTVDRLKIEQIWLNLYHGGTEVSPYDQHLYIDNVVVASQYIGPMNAAVPEEPDPPDPGGDTDPPTPDPATWASMPAATGQSAISMTAAAGSDPSGPVEYYFAETSGNPGGGDSGWQSSPEYTDTGLSADTQYTYRVRLRDAHGNTGLWSTSENATTLSGNAPDDGSDDGSDCFIDALSARSTI